MITRDIPVMLRTCVVCDRTFTAPRKPGRPPVTCSDECKAERGAHGPVRLLEGAARGTGFLDMTGDGSRHSSGGSASSRDGMPVGSDPRSGEQGAVLDVLGEPESTARGWSVVAGDAPVTDAAGRYVRDDDGRVVRRFRNHYAEANSREGQERPAERFPVIGQGDLPHDWQERLDAGETLDAVRLTEWLGVPIDGWEGAMPPLP